MVEFGFEFWFLGVSFNVIVFLLLFEFGFGIEIVVGGFWGGGRNCLGKVFYRMIRDFGCVMFID